MCLYWKKLHTCEHVSDRLYIEMCRPGYLSNTVCPDISEDPSPRTSHFPCWTCIKAEVRSDIETQAILEQEAIAKANEAKEKAIKEKQAAELKLKEERVRRQAKEKAIKEREEELRIKREKEEEERRARKEGGLWIETANGKKGKGRKSGGNAGLTTPLPDPPNMKTVAGLKDRKENSPKKERSMDTGRVGCWGPKKILSRKENVGTNANGRGMNSNANGEAK
ncbi:Nn.00g117120.m01.CDS01 [Neocucurbitaria sp. VM-36]